MVAGAVAIKNRERRVGLAIVVLLLLAFALINPMIRDWVIAGGTILFVLWIASCVSESKWKSTIPRAAPFTRHRPSTGTRTMLRKDVNAHITRDGWRFLWKKNCRYWFEGTGCPPRHLTAAQFQTLERTMLDHPVLIAESGERRFWWYRGGFYWENDFLESEDVLALILKQEQDKRRTLEHARVLMAATLGGQDQSRHRAAIPENIKRFVFQRDGGQCQNCGSTELLQFDHIIPVVMGGSSEPENLQLLCAPCNRRKGGSI